VGGEYRGKFLHFFFSCVSQRQKDSEEEKEGRKDAREGKGFLIQRVGNKAQLQRLK
jgi:hypothetical protein